MPPARTAKILIVEDEIIIRLAAVDAIEEAGYEAVEAANADDAIKALEGDSQIHLVFTDIEMAGSMDGVRLAAYVRDRWPPVEIIITSGRVLVDDITLPARGIFMPKPYRGEELVSKVNALIEA